MGPWRKIESVPVQKVKFEDEQFKGEFVKRFSYTLRDKGIYCKLNESPAVKNHQFQLRQEIKQLKYI